ncbi:MAG TPA: hypothetical protein VG364_08270, partial [Candidatus Dormibacteraeota bacterium]|nr:hypothetical protein [Candidatus Dormibacteraeota bacterium]
MRALELTEQEIYGPAADLVFVLLNVREVRLDESIARRVEARDHRSIEAPELTHHIANELRNREFRRDERRDGFVRHDEFADDLSIGLNPGSGIPLSVAAGHPHSDGQGREDVLSIEAKAALAERRAEAREPVL